MTYLEDTLKVIDFIQRNTLIPCAIDNDIEGYHDLCFWDGIKTTNGTLTVNPDVAHPGDLLHEAGHLAILPLTYSRYQPLGMVGDSLDHSKDFLLQSYLARCRYRHPR
jgi:hypothetical protein